MRFGNIIRPGKQGAGGGGAAAFPAMVSAALRGEPYKVTALEGIKDDFVYVKDVAQGLVRATDVDDVTNWAFNIGTGIASTMEDFAAAVRQVVPEPTSPSTSCLAWTITKSAACSTSSAPAKSSTTEPEFLLPAAVADLAQQLSS